MSSQQIVPEVMFGNWMVQPIQLQKLQTQA